MKYNINFISVGLLVLLMFAACDKGDNLVNEATYVDHPRILLLESEEQQIQDLIDSDETWEKMHLAILEESNNILSTAPLERVMIGYRLLSTSRELLRRIFFLSYSYRMTQDERFLRKAREELLAVCRFYNWNPSHFLDAAEMTMGVAIGYDWLYDDLSSNVRYIIVVWNVSSFLGCCVI